MAETSQTDNANPVIEQLEEKDKTSAIAVAGHPLHAMSVHFPIALVFGTLAVDVFYWFTADPFWLRVGLWSSGTAFGAGDDHHACHGSMGCDSLWPRSGAGECECGLVVFDGDHLA